LSSLKFLFICACVMLSNFFMRKRTSPLCPEVGNKLGVCPMDPLPSHRPKAVSVKVLNFKYSTPSLPAILVT
jgi:hypothetical protein